MLITRKFLTDAADTFVVAVAVALVVDAESLVAVGSTEQLLAVSVAVGRAALIAGIRSVVPRFVALRDRDSLEV